MGTLVTHNSAQNRGNTCYTEDLGDVANKINYKNLIAFVTKVLTCHGRTNQRAFWTW